MMSMACHSLSVLLLPGWLVAKGRIVAIRSVYLCSRVEKGEKLAKGEADHTEVRASTASRYPYHREQEELPISLDLSREWVGRCERSGRRVAARSQL